MKKNLFLSPHLQVQVSDIEGRGVFSSKDIGFRSEFKAYLINSSSCFDFKKDNKILLLKRQDTGHEDEKYSLITGHLDVDETVLQSTVRESKEETGIILKPEALNVVHMLHRRNKKEIW